MNTVQSTLSSPRNQRIIFFAALLVLVAGIVALIVHFVGNGSQPSVAPSPGFKPTLPTKTQTLTTANGAKVTSYDSLPADVKTAIRGFIVPGVLNNNYGPSWKYTAPNITGGLSQQKWAKVDARSLIPLPGYTLKGAPFKLEEATTKNVLLTVRMQPTKPSVGQPVPFRIGLHTYGKAGHQRWLVNYWMPATSFQKVPYSGDG